MIFASSFEFMHATLTHAEPPVTCAVEFRAMQRSYRELPALPFLPLVGSLPWLVRPEGFLEQLKALGIPEATTS